MVEGKKEEKKDKAKAEVKAKPEVKVQAKEVKPKEEAKVKAEVKEEKPKEEKKEEPKAEAKPFSSILARKVGMTQIYDKDGNVVPVTAVEAGPCVVIQKKTKEIDGYSALQLGFGKRKNVKKPVIGHLKKANPEIAPKFLREVRVENTTTWNVGETIKADIFKAGDVVTVSGTSIGKGFAGTVKKWHFSRGPMTHGSKSHRIPGSIGAGTTPGRVYKGTKMPGRQGGVAVTVPSVKVQEVDLGANLLLLKGAVPGKKGSFLIIRKAS